MKEKIKQFVKSNYDCVIVGGLTVVCTYWMGLSMYKQGYIHGLRYGYKQGFTDLCNILDEHIEQD